MWGVRAVRALASTRRLAALQLPPAHLSNPPPLTRLYAKGRDKKKADKGKSKRVDINEDQLSQIINLTKLKTDLEHAVSKLREDFLKNVSLRSSSGALESLKVQFEGKSYELIELAQINRKNPKVIIVNMVNFPQALPAVLKSLSTSGMNLNPQQDGTTISLAIPRVTREHRETLAKNAKALFIKCRDHIKDIQVKYTKTVKSKEKDGLSSDEAHEISDQVAFLADQSLSEAEKLYQAKHNELVGDS